MKTGNLFHSAGPANAKARFPNFLIDRVTLSPSEVHVRGASSLFGLSNNGRP